MSSWGVDPTIFKVLLDETVFKNMVPNFTVLESMFEA